jgi:exosortase
LGIILTAFGTAHFKKLIVPFLYLLIAFTIVEDVLNTFSLDFQIITAYIADSLLKLFGYSVYREGQFICLPHINLEVARVCNGIHHIIAIVGITVPLVIIEDIKIWYKIVMVLAAFALGIISNGIRVALIGVWADYRPAGSPLHGPFDILYVGSILFFGLIIIFLIRHVSRRYLDRKGIVKQNAKFKSIVPDQGILRTQRIAFLLLSFMLISALSIFSLHKLIPTPLRQSFSIIPYSTENWTGYDDELTGYPFVDLGYDNMLIRTYTGKGNVQATLMVGYYAAQLNDREILDYRWTHLYKNSRVITLNAKKGRYDINETSLDDDPSTYYYFFFLGQEVLIDRNRTRLESLRSSLLHGRNNGGIFIMRVYRNGVTDAQIRPYVAELIDVFRSFLKSL